MIYKSTLASALEYAKLGKIEDWVQAYLLSDGNNKKFADGLKMTERVYLGPYKMPLSLFTRCCGPETNMRWLVDAAGFESRVASLQNAIRSNIDLPPIIVNFVDDGFELSDGNHRHEAYLRQGIKEIDVVIWITGKPDLEQYLHLYSEKYR